MRIKKIQEQFAEAIQKLKDGSKEDVLKELEETANLVNEEAQEQEAAASDPTPTPEVKEEDVEKILKTESGQKILQEAVKKYVEAWISAPDAEKFKKELSTLISTEVTKAAEEINKKVDELAKTAP